MGVPIALEMARQLRRQGEAVPLLFVLDPPQRNREDEALSAAPPRTLLQKVSRQVRALADRPPGEWMGHLQAETKAQIRYRVLEPLKLAGAGAMRRLGLRVPDPLWHHYVGTVYLRARSRYAHPPYEGDVVVFAGSSDAARETLSSWRELVRGSLHVETFEGTHLDLTMDPELFALWARRLSAVLTEHQSLVGQAPMDQPLASPVMRSARRSTTSESPSTANAAR
jgi:thioesterase domain-containing protein